MHKVLLLLLIIALAFHVTAVQACICTPPPPLVALKKADMVFSGKVVSVPSPDKPLESVVFAVESVWKGEKVSSLAVPIQTQNSCSIEMNVGKSWLVYADKDYFNNTCNRILPLSEAGEDLELLGPGSPPQHTLAKGVWVSAIIATGIIATGIIATGIIAAWSTSRRKKPVTIRNESTNA